MLGYTTGTTHTHTHTHTPQTRQTICLHFTFLAELISKVSTTSQEVDVFLC